MSESNVTTGPDASSGASKGQDALAMVRELRQLVEQGRRRWRRLIILEALGLTIAMPLAYLWLVFLLDNTLHLPVWGRLLASVIFLAGSIWLFVRLFRSWRRSQFTEDQVALAIEKRTPGGLQNRLINSLQLSRESKREAAGLSAAVIAENYQMLKQVQLQQSAESRPAVIRVGMAAVVIAAGAGFWLFGQEYFTNAATRIFLPFADVAPVYKTVLAIEPGDVTISRGGQVELRIRIDGEMPDELFVLTDSGSEQATHRIELEPEQRVASFTLDRVEQSLAYAVRGNDYVSRYYQIRVPTQLELERMTAVLHAPEYTGLAPRPLESVSGDIEALAGTRVEVTFNFNQPLDEAWLLLERRGVSAGESTGTAQPDGEQVAPASTAATQVPQAGEQTEAPQAGEQVQASLPTPVERLPLKKVGPSSFAGHIEMRDVAGYMLESRAGDEPFRTTRRFDLRVTADKGPQLRMSGVDRDAKLAPESVLNLRVSAKDDYGLQEVGLFYRVVSREELASAGAGASSSSELAQWTPVRQWPMTDRRVEFATDYNLPLPMLEAIEGQTLELALRGRDTDPAKVDQWTMGDRLKLTVSGVGVDLQLVYEQILQSETELKVLAASYDKQVEAASQWIEKLSPISGMRWDEPRNVELLAQAMREQAGEQVKLRERAANSARAMVEEAGSLKLSVAMLADTEIVRCVRIIESVARRENPQEMRATLADARLTQQRIIRSLLEIRDQYRGFREDWELGHMVSFTKMLMERQQAMAAAATTYSELAADAISPKQRQAASGRQTKVWELAQLTSVAFAGMAHRGDVVGPVMAQAFAIASEQLKTSELREAITGAATSLEEGLWQQAHQQQTAAAQQLAAIYEALRKAQTDAAAQALLDLQKLAQGDPLLEQELAKLQAGSTVKMTDIADDEEILSEIIRMHALADWMKKKHQLDTDDKKFPDYAWDDSMSGALQGGRPEEADFSILKLAEKPGGQGSFPESSDLPENAMNTKLLEGEFEDLVGDLLEEADDLRDQYETYNLNKHGQGVEEGDIGKQAGDLNSMSAAAATGNMKPPTHNFGGASRVGRQGARAHGLAVGDESINRRGRDEVQEGQQEMADQAGEIRETMSDDPQKDSSTGVGGKLIKDNETSFSTKDTGEWKDEYLERLRDPQAKNQIVERQGKPLDHRVAEMMHDLESTQEQVIERIKAVKKELDALYLPTDHLDDIMAQLAANLERLKDKPDADLFRQQAELIDKLKGAVVVFGRAASDFQQSLPRQQSVRTSILDEPAYPALPGYEAAVSRYYEKLTEQ